MSDTMTAARARWINRRVAWNQHLNTGTRRMTATVVDMTPAELLVEIHEDGGRMWITPEVDGFEVLEDRPLDVSDFVEPTGGFEVGDAVRWNPYFGDGAPGPVYGHVVEVDADNEAATVRDYDGATFRVAFDRIAHRTPDASTTFAGSRKGTGVRVERNPRGIEVVAFDNNRAEGGTEPAVRLSFGTAHELQVWLADQLHNPANDYSATR